MQHILILGIGRSTSYLLDYLNTHLVPNGYVIQAIDVQQELVAKRQSEFPGISFIRSEIHTDTIKISIANTDLVVSMLPPAFHGMVAEICLEYGKHFFTASYISKEIKALETEVKAKGLLFMMECGLDPGIDHMSAMAMIHSLQEKGAVINSFESYTGGLIHPFNLNPPWNYKISWNPRNVVLAGQGNAVQYMEDGIIKIVPYQRLFTKPSVWKVNEQDVYEGYPNRDSLSYRTLYQLSDTSMFIRGTLRYPSFCEGWNYLVQLGLTDDTVLLPEDKNRTGRRFLNHFLPSKTEALDIQLQELFSVNWQKALDYLQALGLTDEIPVISKAATPAEIIQSILESRWSMQAGDRDRIVMIHRIQYTWNNTPKTLQSTLVVDGKNADYTAMAKTVGLPLAIAIDLFVHGQIRATGIHIPITKEWYEPILNRLKLLGIVFNEVEEA
jgi:saccharopine dehydrogenase-like NADP-dependent oxidoreductase